MLRRLHIRNYVLIDSLDIDFPEGLVIITGQTGAGKSILLGSLALVSGAKADAAQILRGGENCIVEAEYEAGSDDHRLRELVEGNDLDWDEGHLTIRRVVNASGRSRCFVNDSPVPVQLLSELSSLLVDIHSQHGSLILNDRRFQLSILDGYAGCTSLLEDCAEAWKGLQSIKSQLSEAESRLERLSSDSEYNRAQFRQLDAARLREGELEELEAEHKELSHAEQIKENLASACASIEGLSALRDARKALEHIGGLVPSAAELAGRLESSRIELDDILRELQALDDRIGINAGRLESIEARMSEIYGLLKKFNCREVAELIRLRDVFAGSLDDSEELSESIKDLRKALDAKQKEYDGICAELHLKRSEAAPRFAKEITGSLHYLELERSVFLTDIADSAPGPRGRDAVVFRFAADGTGPVDVAKCASGGEISRIMLCLKAMMARYASMPTLVFDEIDAGVSGSVADKMGSMICLMGRDMQVLSITHLPQVAAKGDAHFVVSKEYPGGEAVTRIARVEGEDRVLEIARLLSGASITAEAIANAKSLLNA